MTHLVKGLYGHQFENGSNLFGLRCGQCLGDDFIHNGGWYNKDGEKLGWGDLSVQNFFHIRGGLVHDGIDEMFIILHESDSFWNFVERVGTIGSMAAVKPTAEAPGVEYVAEKAAFIINKNGFYMVDEYSRKEESVTIKGIMFYVLKREEVKDFMLRNGTRTATAS